ncbi:MAG TPA: lipoprotein-releasing ABC transporter permease subunit [Syntrophorhabdaceae bacterium]|jgi:lipoprotein-releasing system permease protein
MKYESIIGLRYLRSKRKEAFISFTTWMSVAGIAIGVMALIVVIAVMTGFQDEIRERILGINPHVVVLWDPRGIDKTPAQVVDAIKTIPGVTHTFPYVTFQAIVQRGSQLSGVAVKSFNPDQVKFMAGLMKEGRIDSLSQPGTVIMGKEIASHLGLFQGDSFTLMVPFGGISPMGAVPETVKVRVGGVFETGMYEIDNTLIIMSLEDAEKMFGLGPMGVEVKLADVYKAGDVQKEITRRLGPGYFARTWIQMNKNLFSALKLEKIAMFIILALIILVASFNIVSSLIMTVMEKRKDIAILKSIGAKKRSIIKIFMVEGITIGIFGALIGSFSGYILCQIQQTYHIITLPRDIYYISTLPMKISLFDVFLLALVTTCICILATLYPSYRAAKIDPVETLRYE